MFVSQVPSLPQSLLSKQFLVAFSEHVPTLLSSHLISGIKYLLLVHNLTLLIDSQTLFFLKESGPTIHSPYPQLSSSLLLLFMIKVNQLH